MFKVDKITFDPITKSKIFDIDMTGAWSGFLRIAHSSTSVVIFVSNGCGFLRDAEVPQDAANEECHSTNIACGHEFRLRRR